MLNILYFFNEKYVPYAGVSIVSLLENNKTVNKITIYMLGEGVSEESQQKLTEQIRKYGRNAVYIDAEAYIEKMKASGINEYRGAYAPNLKLVVSWFVPEDVERILYLDCDTIVMRNLEVLNAFDLHHKPIGMCKDSMCKEHKMEIGFSEKDAYYNSGVILYDMNTWRKQKCTEQMVEHLRNVRCHYMAPDQDMINIVMKDNIEDMGPAYNLQPMHSVYSYEMYNKYFGSEAYYTKNEIEAAVSCPMIYHTFRYLGGFPWHKDCMHPNTDVFDRYMAISEWADYEKQESERDDFMFRIERFMYKVLPRTVFIRVFKVFYEIFMWKSGKDSRKGRNNIRM